jgi:hypothetical protein
VTSQVLPGWRRASSAHAKTEIRQIGGVEAGAARGGEAKRSVPAAKPSNLGSHAQVTTTVYQANGTSQVAGTRMGRSLLPLDLTSPQLWATSSSSCQWSLPSSQARYPSLKPDYSAQLPLSPLLSPPSHPSPQQLHTQDLASPLPARLHLYPRASRCIFTPSNTGKSTWPAVSGSPFNSHSCAASPSTCHSGFLNVTLGFIPQTRVALDLGHAGDA